MKGQRITEVIRTVSLFQKSMAMCICISVIRRLRQSQLFYSLYVFTKVQVQDMTWYVRQ